LTDRLNAGPLVHMHGSSGDRGRSITFRTWTMAAATKRTRYCRQE